LYYSARNADFTDVQAKFFGIVCDIHLELELLHKRIDRKVQAVLCVDDVGLVNDIVDQVDGRDPVVTAA
jgi:hypothetical protein